MIFPWLRTPPRSPKNPVAPPVIATSTRNRLVSSVCLGIRTLNWLNFSAFARRRSIIGKLIFQSFYSPSRAGRQLRMPRSQMDCTKEPGDILTLTFTFLAMKAVSPSRPSRSITRRTPQLLPCGCVTDSRRNGGKSLMALTRMFLSRQSRLSWK
ncbi:MAG: hypothetical protein JWO78_197 [Micavibrio sp.]|nr:hypothetical protein [Micavibrio sp.]